MPSYGIKEFIQLFGFGIAAALMSMWTTQKVLTNRMDAFDKRLDEVSTATALQISSNKQYFQYIVDKYTKRHDAECAEMKRKVDFILASGYYKAPDTLGVQ